MDKLLTLLDWVWNIRFLTGYRTVIAQVILGAVSSYQAIASSKEAWAAGLHFPPMATAIYIALVAYFSAKVAQFAKEHTTPTP